MASLREKVEAELEQIDQALNELPGGRRVRKLSALELAGTASLLSSVYHGMENVLKQGVVALGGRLPTGAAWHRDLLQSACAHGIVSEGLRDRLAAYLAFRHFFTHAYGFQIDPQKLTPLVREARAVCACFEAEVQRLVHQQTTKSHRSRPSLRRGGRKPSARS